jgi:hypothetical protein
VIVCAGALMILVTVVAGCAGVLQVVAVRAIDRDAAPDSLTQATNLVITVEFLMALGVGLLGRWVREGANSARITAWVLLALTMVMSLLAMSQLDSALDGWAGGARVDPVYPGWYFPLMQGQAVVVLAACLAGAVLLALPPANAHFRADQRRGV